MHNNAIIYRIAAALGDRAEAAGRVRAAEGDREAEGGRRRAAGRHRQARLRDHRHHGRHAGAMAHACCSPTRVQIVILFAVAALKLMTFQGKIETLMRICEVDEAADVIDKADGAQMYSPG